MIAGQVVKVAAIHQSVGSSGLTVDSQRNLKVLICCVDFLCLCQRQLTLG